MMMDHHQEAARVYISSETESPSPICPYELSSLRSLAAYVARDRGMPLDLVEIMVAVRFKTKDITRLSRDDFRMAIAFLSDLRPATRNAR
jgi:hypothetical protein